MRQFKILFILLSVEFQNCDLDYKSEKSYCPNSISIKTVDVHNNSEVTDYELYETTNYPEGIIMKIQSVANKYRFKDNRGKICIPILPDSTFKFIKFRKFVFVKSNYVYTEYFLKNASADTLLRVIPLNNKGSR